MEPVTATGKIDSVVRAVEASVVVIAVDVILATKARIVIEENANDDRST